VSYEGGLDAARGERVESKELRFQFFVDAGERFAFRRDT
jgi:hypothetical protein